jgi:predicted permease
MRDWHSYVGRHLALPRAGRRRRDRIVAELAAQLEEVFQEALAAGASEADADLEALSHIGDWQQLQHDLEQADGVRLAARAGHWCDRTELAMNRSSRLLCPLADLSNDLRYAARTLLKSRSWFAVAVLILALGIGANTAIFSVLKAVVLRPLPYPDPHRMVYIWMVNTATGTWHGLSGPDFLDWYEQSQSFAAWGAYTLEPANLSNGVVAELGSGVRCTSGLLESLAARPVMGRLLSTADEAAGAPPVTVLSHRTWQRMFAGDTEIIGSQVRLNSLPHTVIGVLSPDFESPIEVYDRGGPFGPDFWLPLAVSADDAPRDAYRFPAIGLLREGVTIESAQAELQAIAGALADEYPDTNTGESALLRPLKEQIVARVTGKLWLLMGAVGLVLLIVCANITSLLLARGSARYGEIALRAALGASWHRLLRLLLAESLLLATIGGITGVSLAWTGVKLLRFLVPETLPRSGALQIDWSVLLFVLILTLLTGLLFGIAPGLTIARRDPAQVLRGGNQPNTVTPAKIRFLGGLVVTQLALALVLANGAVLVLASYLRAAGECELQDPQQTLITSITLTGPRYQEQEQINQLDRELLGRFESLPGVTSAGMTTQFPLYSHSRGDVLVDNEELDRGEPRPPVVFTWSSPGYFDAIGIRMLAGRTFVEGQDVQGDQLGIVVNRAFAERFWPGQSVIGKRVRASTSPPWFQARVVGMVDNVRQRGLESEVQGEIFFPLPHSSLPFRNLAIRATGDPLQLVHAVRHELAALDSDLALSRIGTGEELYTWAAQRWRFFATLTGLFAGLALVLVGVGTFGVVSFFTTECRYEVGVRIALGADRRSVLRMFLEDGLRLSLVGIALGLIATIFTAGLTEQMLFQVSPLDPLSVTGVALLLVTVTAGACFVPALRATRIDPASALRSE